MLLAYGLFAPTSAMAGCGDHVRPNEYRSGFRSLAAVEMLEASKADAEMPERRNLPCSGPSCSQAPNVPFVPAPTPSLRTELWCLTTFAFLVGDPDSSIHLTDSDAIRSIHRSSSLERPPRLPS